MFKKLFLAVFSSLIAVNSHASQPEPWQLGFQESVTPIMDGFVDFHNELLIIITAITIFVTLLLVYVCIRFSAKNNPVPSKTSHNTLIEIVWTVVPILILVYIAFPSMRTLYFNETIPEDAEITLKVIGKQWYWEYQYPDQGLAFRSDMVADDDLKEGQPRLLTVDNEVVLPVNTVVRLQSTGGDVIHNWAIPAFGTKLEAVPGRLNEGWIKATKTGTYYGQCSELCGSGHGFMPITVKIVTKKEFDSWVESVKPEFGVES